MNTIPTTSKNIRLPYTIVGERKGDVLLKSAPHISLLVLNRGGRIYRNEFFRDLERLGNFDVVSVEDPGETYDIESLSKRFPSVKFLRLHEKASPGEKINIGMEEARGRYVFVFWNDMRISSPLPSPGDTGNLDDSVLCRSPIFQSVRVETVPSLMVPAYFRTRIRIIPLMPSKEGTETLFPFDYTGMYSREKFMNLGGYDYCLTNPFWQKMDFGFRAYMWGEKMLCGTGIRVQYLSDIPSEDTTPDENHKMFFLKNLSIRFNGDTGSLPPGRFIPYYFRSGGHLFSALREFREARKWVDVNKYRFVRDARSVTELWEVSET